MHTNAAVSPYSSLRALRGAVGEVVGAGDAVGGWDRLVSLWRIFLALDRLIAVLWSIVDRLAEGEASLDGGCPAGAAAMLAERPDVAGFCLVRRGLRLRTAVLPVVMRPVAAGVRAVAGAVAWPGTARRGRDMVRVSPDLAVRYQQLSELGWGTRRNCALIVPV